MFYVGLWKDMFWSEVSAVYSHNMRDQVFWHLFFTFLYWRLFFVIVEYSAIIENNNNK